jgi:hypothetical protein
MLHEETVVRLGPLAFNADLKVVEPNDLTSISNSSLRALIKPSDVPSAVRELRLVS